MCWQCVWTLQTGGHLPRECSKLRWIALGDLGIPRTWTFIPEKHFLKKRKKSHASAFVHQLEPSSKGHGIPVSFAVQWLSHIWLSATPWTAAHQASLSVTNSQSLHKLMPIESVMPSNPLILCHILLFLPSIFPSFRVFSTELVLLIRLPNYWSSTSLPNE